MAHHRLRTEPADTDVSMVRGGIVDRVPTTAADGRFVFVPSIDTPTGWITDTVTERSTQIPLHAARATMNTLDELFRQ